MQRQVLSMLRPVFLVVLALAVSGGQAQQVESRGAPASVLSPTSPGAAHGTPAGVNSPIPANNGLFITPRRPPVRFGNPRVHRTRRDRNLFPVPIFIPAYPLAGDYVNPADPTVAEQPDSGDAPAESASADDVVREAYYRGARDALAQQRADSRYGEHYLDSREKSQNPPGKDKEKAQSKEAVSEEEAATNAPANQEPVDNGPAAVFIFKDGHRLETHNYAIQGQTLFDFSDNHLTKIKLADLDLDATKKANDNLGINVKFPPGAP